MKIDFGSQRIEILLFLKTNMAAMTSRANKQLNSFGCGLLASLQDRKTDVNA